MSCSSTECGIDASATEDIASHDTAADGVPERALEILREWSCTPEIVAIIENAARALDDLARNQAA